MPLKPVTALAIFMKVPASTFPVAILFAALYAAMKGAVAGIADNIILRPGLADFPMVLMP